MFCYLEAEIKFYVNHVIVMLGCRSVVDASVFDIDLEVLVEGIVGPYLIESLGAVPLLRLTIEVVAGFDMQFLLHYRSDTECVDTIGFVGIEAAVPTLAMDIFRSECPIIVSILAREGLSVLFANASPASRPSESANT